MGTHAHAQISTASVILLVLFVSGCASLSAAAGLKHSDSSKKLSMLHGGNSRKLQSPCGDPPLCIPELMVNCEVGGVSLGCTCDFVHACRPGVSGCSLYQYGTNIGYCGF